MSGNMESFPSDEEIDALHDKLMKKIEPLMKIIEKQDERIVPTISLFVIMSILSKRSLIEALGILELTKKHILEQDDKQDQGEFEDLMRGKRLNFIS